MKFSKTLSLLTAKLRSTYRLILINDYTYKEAVNFKLTKLKIYIAISSLTIVLVVFTMAIIIITPLKYYIPGYANINTNQAFIALKRRADSLEKQVRFKDQFLSSIKMVLSQDAKKISDTSQLSVIDPTEDY